MPEYLVPGVYVEEISLRKSSLGGSVVIFAGPRGAGKRRMARRTAGLVGRGLQRVRAVDVIAEFIGETEKNLAQLFDAARKSGAVLLFDEADALFARRSRVKDAHDRYANIEVSHLLREMEEFEGVVILSTNMRNSLPRKLEKRCSYRVDFGEPE